MAPIDKQVILQYTPVFPWVPQYGLEILCVEDGKWAGPPGGETFFGFDPPLVDVDVDGVLRQYPGSLEVRMNFEQMGWFEPGWPADPGYPDPTAENFHKFFRIIQGAPAPGGHGGRRLLIFYLPNVLLKQNPWVGPDLTGRTLDGRAVMQWREAPSYSVVQPSDGLVKKVTLTLLKGAVVIDQDPQGTGAYQPFFVP